MRTDTSLTPTATTLLEAARAAILENGYAALSTRSVAERAGVPLSQIHYHFGSKANLVLALFEHENAKLLDRQAALYAGDEPLAEQWSRACDYFDADLESGYVRLLHEMLAAGWSTPAIGERVRQALDGWISVLTGAFEHHASRGVSLGPLTPAQAVALTSAAFLGAETIILAGQDTVPVREALRAVGALWQNEEATT
ncbi:TetR family transcriptional regulator [Microbacterium awajiense]|uniref:TetR family transcriptional regulator n=1 Tax=Microbacterium awajiense TaxID=415214 RepID=A0ABP7ATF1_9MICO